MILLTDVEKSDMECLLQFIYLGEVTTPADNLNGLIKVARALGVRGEALDDCECTCSTY